MYHTTYGCPTLAMGSAFLKDVPSAVVSAWRHPVASFDSTGLHCQGINTYPMREGLTFELRAPSFAEPPHARHVWLDTHIIVARDHRPSLFRYVIASPSLDAIIRFDAVTGPRLAFMLSSWFALATSTGLITLEQSLYQTYSMLLTSD